MAYINYKDEQIMGMDADQLTKLSGALLDQTNAITDALTLLTNAAVILADNGMDEETDIMSTIEDAESVRDNIMRMQQRLAIAWHSLGSPEEMREAYLDRMEREARLHDAEKAL